MAYQKQEHDDYNFEELEALLAKAGISAAEMAKLCRVSRSTVYNWFSTGYGPNQPMLRGMVVRGIRMIERAVAAKALPRQEVKRKTAFQDLAAILRRFAG